MLSSRILKSKLYNKLSFFDTKIEINIKLRDLLLIQ